MDTYKKPSTLARKDAQQLTNRVYKKKKRMEFSKILVVWAIAMTTLCVAISYGLALFNHDPVQDVTTAVAAACISICVAYKAKSYGEKNSRNKYGVDKNGNRIDDNEDEGAVG